MTRRRKWVGGARDAAIFVAGMSGLTVSLLGGAACLLGLSSAAILRLADVVRPHQRDIAALFRYGGMGVGSGLILFGVNAAIARSCGERDFAAEEAAKAKPPAANPLAPCAGCRNLHGLAHNGVLLVCAIHPLGWEQGGGCPDWREKP